MVAAQHRSIFREFLEESSFLYEQRQAALADRNVGLEDLAELEERLEAHLDGLVVGGNDAWKTCEERLGLGDPGELHAIVRVACRCQRADALLEIATKLEDGELEARQAFGDALKHELNPGWTRWVEQSLSLGLGKLNAALAWACGYQRLPVGARLCEQLGTARAEPAAPCLWALGQLREPAAGPVFLRKMREPDHEAGRQAAIGALRLGLPEAPALIEQQALRFTWAPVPLALSGQSRAYALLSRIAREARSHDALMALGLLGDPACIEVLLSLLESDDSAEAAAQALFLMTGAELFEESVPATPAVEHGDGDEDEERVEPTRRLAQSPGAWHEWWSSNGGRFRPGSRYRLGEPSSAAVSLHSLRATVLSLEVRGWIADELLIRHGQDLVYAPDMEVSAQNRALSAART